MREELKIYSEIELNIIKFSTPQLTHIEETSARLFKRGESFPVTEVVWIVIGSTTKLPSLWCLLVNVFEDFRFVNVFGCLVTKSSTSASFLQSFALAAVHVWKILVKEG